MGPWSRSFVTAVVGRLERPSAEALAEARDLTVEVGVIRAEVGACTVTLGADPVPPRIWAAMVRFAQGRGPLEEAAAGRIQSVHLEQLMAEDWGEPLIPRARAISRACSCDGGESCEHIVAVTFVVADAFHDDASMLLRWRGCIENPPAIDTRSVVPDRARRPEDPWRGGALPAPAARRVLPAGAVLRRLGTSEIRVGDDDLAEALRAAYEELSSPGRDSAV